jgi:ketosteroid isomerase-like protein
MSQHEQRQANNLEDVERIYRKWDEALAKNDAEGLLALYAPDAVLESPLVPHLMGSGIGICRGHAELRPFFERLASRKPEIRRYYRTGYLTDGKKTHVGVSTHNTKWRASSTPARRPWSSWANSTFAGRLSSSMAFQSGRSFSRIRVPAARWDTVMPTSLLSFPRATVMR